MIENAFDTFVRANSTLLFSPSEQISTATSLIISTIGIFGLGAILIASVFYRHSPHGMIIISLCIASLINCLDSVVAASRNLAMGGLMSGQSGLDKCKTEGFLYLVSISLAMISLVLVAIERYLVILWGVNNHSKQTIIAIVISWIYAIGYATTTIVSGENFRLLSGRSTCSPLCDVSSMYPLCLFAGVVITLTISLASFCYLKLFIFYQKSNRIREVSDSDTKERQLFQKFTVIILSFSLTTMPYFASFTYEALTGMPVSAVVGHVTGNLLNMNAAITPYTLYILDPSIKQQVNQVFGIAGLYSKLFQSRLSISPKANRIVKIDGVDVKKTAALNSTVIIQK